MRQYDWVNLKSQFITGKWPTIADFFRKQDIKNNSYSRRRTKGWPEERRQYQEKVVLSPLFSVLVQENLGYIKTCSAPHPLKHHTRI